MQENDPDILQLLDETNTQWVKQWRRACKSHDSDITFLIRQTTEVKVTHKKPNK